MSNEIEIIDPITPNERILYDHVSAVVIANPGKDASFISRSLEMPLKKVESILRDDKFNRFLDERREKMFGTLMRNAQLANNVLHMKTIGLAIDRVDSMENNDLVKVLEVSGKNIGLHKNNGPQVAVQNNFVVKWIGEE